MVGFARNYDVEQVPSFRFKDIKTYRRIQDMWNFRVLILHPPDHAGDEDMGLSLFIYVKSLAKSLYFNILARADICIEKSEKGCFTLKPTACKGASFPEVLTFPQCNDFLAHEFRPRC